MLLLLLLSPLMFLDELEPYERLSLRDDCLERFC